MKMPVTDLTTANYKLSGGSTSTMYYVHNDYLGSITAITDEDGNLVESLSYDPWGRRRNADDWTDYNVSSTLFDRGYTGHEHLDQFGLINMNGRVYDPFLARFLSPDPFVQAPGYSQNYNRYSYAWNNPLRFVDPSGFINQYPDEGVVRRHMDGGSAPNWYPFASGGRYGPGSNNHWSDQYRSESGNFMLMNQSSFINRYGIASYYMNMARVTGNLTTLTNPNLIAAFLPAATSTSRRLWGDRAGGFFFEYDPISKNFFVPGTNTIIDIVKEYSNYLSGKSVSGRVATSGRVDGSGEDKTYGSVMEGDIYQAGAAVNALVNISSTDAWTKSVKYVEIVSSEAQAQKVLYKIARGTKYAGWVGNTLSLGVSYTEAFVNRNGPNAGFYQAQAVGSTVIVGLNALNFVVPGLGTVLSITAGAVDAAGGFNWIYESFND